MIAGIFHQGSGVGNQLHRYVATRVLALDKGYDFSMVAPENCKVKDFMNLDMGGKNSLHYDTLQPSGEVVPRYSDGPMNGRLWGQWAEKTNYYNPEFNFVADGMIIDGEFQDERYFGHRLKEIDKWLKVEPIEIPDDTCVIGFRGGEFYVFPELGLPKSYYDEAIEIMESKGITNFEVHTDDEVLARRFFPDFKVIHDIGINWRSIRYAKYAIIANSSFYILPRLLAHQYHVKTIAPRYWARRNTKEWSMPQNYYSCFSYI